MSRGAHSSGYFPNPWREAGQLTAGIPVPSAAVRRRRGLVRLLAPLALFVGASALLTGFVVGMVMTRTPVVMPVPDGVHQIGPVPGDLDSGAGRTVLPPNVVTTSP